MKDEQNFTRVQQPFCKGRPIMNTEFKIPYFYMTGKHGKGKKKIWKKEQSVGGRREGKRKTTFLKHESLNMGWNSLVLFSC